MRPKFCKVLIFFRFNFTKIPSEISQDIFGYITHQRNEYISHEAWKVIEEIGKIFKKKVIPK
jgi:aspartate-semialdehyde dehydrogenase